MEYVMSGFVETHGQQYRIDLASPDLFAAWVAGVIRHRCPSITGGPAKIVVTYSGPANPR